MVGSDNVGLSNDADGVEENRRNDCATPHSAVSDIAKETKD